MENQWFRFKCLAHLDCERGWLITMVNCEEFPLGKSLEIIVATCHLIVVLVLIATLADESMISTELHGTLLADSIRLGRIALLLNSVLPLATHLQELKQVGVVFLSRHRNKIRAVILNDLSPYTNYADF